MIGGIDVLKISIQLTACNEIILFGASLSVSKVFIM